MNLDPKYIHGIDVKTATTLERFAAAAAEADYHLSEALKSMRASLAFFASREVASDMRTRGAQVEYGYRTLEAQIDAVREHKLGFAILMFGDSTEPPVREDIPPVLAKTDAGDVHKRMVAAGRPDPAPTDVTGAGHTLQPVPGSPFSVLDGDFGKQLPQVHRGEDR